MPLKEIINAIADGIDIEVRLKEDTHWLTWHREMMTPLEIDAEDYEWRTKPEPKPDVVKYGLAWERIWDCKPMSGDNLKLTFDGETGKLKSAEVIS